MIQYVAGLLYDDQGMRVTLILKNRPQWQAGLYNAIGGKVEQGETIEEAMRREFIEEAGVDLDWTYRMSLHDARGDYKVHFFSCHDETAMEHLATMTDEQVEVVETYNLPDNIVANLWWIIPMMNDDSLVQQDIQVDQG